MAEAIPPNIQNGGEMSEYSEASVRVFERALDTLKGKLDEERLSALRKLLEARQLADMGQVEQILGPKAAPDAD